MRTPPHARSIKRMKPMLTILVACVASVKNVTALHSSNRSDPNPPQPLSSSLYINEEEGFHNIQSRDRMRKFNYATQYANWKTKRRNSYNDSISHSERHLIEQGDDDELFFDSNGMPIQHDDDDDVGEIRDPVPKEEAESTPMAVVDNEKNEKVDASLKPEADNKEEEETATESSTNNPSPTQLFNNTHHSSTTTETSKEADTIFDDILRGFSFAFLFTLSVLTLHKLCHYTCIRCGIIPDDRLLEARWKRYQLKHKRAYAFNPHGPSGMDGKSLGRWFDQRDRMHPDGIWDVTDQRSVGSWFDDEYDDQSSGAIDFDDANGMIQLSSLDRDDASSATELEYGEGEELEDKSHDERLFDVEDGGAGLKRQAKKFFDGGAHVAKKLFGEKKINRTEQRTDKESAARQKSNDDISEDDFFDALQPPSGTRVDAFNQEAESDSSNNGAQEFLQKQINQPPNPSPTSSQSNANANSYQDDNNEDFNNDLFLDDDRGYDEESDLLGLRSDSPPPLDLEEIEKKTLENLENAKSYY